MMKVAFRGAPLVQSDVLEISLRGKAAAAVREALQSGEYGSADQVVEDALRSWQREPDEEEVAFLRAAWNEAVREGDPGLDPEPVNARLREKFRLPMPTASG